MSPLRKIILKSYQSPGDVVMLTAALRDLKRAYPNFLIDVRTSAPEIWENNHLITPLDEDDPEVEIISAEYPLIHTSNVCSYHFIHAYRLHLEDKLGLRIPQGEFKGDIYLSPEEKVWASQTQEFGLNQNFWIMMGGGKFDFTAKWWNPTEYQKVIDYFREKILFVQCGERGHFHPEIKNTLNLIGKTDTRQFIRLVHHSSGVLCPVTFAMHLAAAVETKRSAPINRACVVLAGGREPAQWEAYPHHRFLSLNGALDCCDNGGCWKSRTFAIGDGDEKDNSLCIYPKEIDYKALFPHDSKEQNLKIPKCLDMIKAEDVIRAIETYYEGGALQYDGGWEKAAPILRNNSKKDEVIDVGEATAEPENQSERTLSEF